MESPEKNLKFLVEAFDLMPTCSSKLVCHYLSHCCKYEGISDLKLPSNLIRKSSICKFCGNKWLKGEFRSVVFPRKRIGKRTRKLVRKSEGNPYLLRKCEEKMLRMVDKVKQNRLILVCKQCHKKTIIPMQVPEFRHESKSLTDKVVAVASQKKRKKKKKAKDSFCGLNPAAVAHAKGLNELTVWAKPSNAADNSVKEKLNVSLNKSTVIKKRQLKTSQTLLPGEILHVLQSEAKRRTHSNSSLRNFLASVT